MRVTLAAAVYLLAGCAARPDPPRVPVYPVEGKLIVSGRPAGNSRVVFHPVARDDSAPPLIPVANTRSDGTFRLTTYAVGDGAPAGEYVVTVVWVNEKVPVDECEGVDLMTHDRLCGLYADPATSTLRATVTPGPNEITIQAAAGGRGWNLPRLQGAGKKDGLPNPRDPNSRY